MDPVQEELHRYIHIRDRLLLDVQQKEEELQSFYRTLRIFEISFLEKVEPLQHTLDRWKHRSAIMELLLNRLETEESLPLTRLQWQIQAESQLQEPKQEVRPTPIPILSKEEHKEAKKLYRDLARRFHPDLIQDTKKREERRVVMAQINQAYQENQLDLLREQQYFPDITEGENENLADVWTRLVREIAMLRKKIAEQESQLHKARTSELASLLIRSETDAEQCFQEIQEMLRTKILVEQQRWRQLRIQEERYWVERDT